MIDHDKVTGILMREEGEKKAGGLHVPYYDHLGYLTIGYGLLIDPVVGGGLYQEEAMFCLKFRQKKVEYELKNKIDFFNLLSNGRQEALLLMAYQMGVPRVLGFKKMLKAMKEQDFEKAYVEAVDSTWYNQTPARAGRVARMIRKGE